MLYNVKCTLEFTVQVHADSEDQALERAEKRMEKHDFDVADVDDLSYVVDEVMNDDGTEIEDED